MTVDVSGQNAQTAQQSLHKRHPTLPKHPICERVGSAAVPAASTASGIRFFLLRTQEGWKIKEFAANGSDATHLSLW
ncbi:hypothetical protein [Bifidobacterium crudilactis]|jgi:hypothetical protein|uniref:hypothetical protein n=1 Tax=Bifidobacterium crudilactis TaxID=327277 RepID=UPI0026477C13|nr:hypothetical protein [Bifidobacterium crudilactis]MCI1664263.1 hypothetical protein [Bifidobacterium crudilactis]MDN6001081.1 hypothetical protein [Bifidobacterium crudilactis]MDN6654541.1 hypothetical protein [Bifidobacterium crudilactis]MDN6853967.1 hypothetical protein [Bifidobacterium crudilactis]